MKISELQDEHYKLTDEYDKFKSDQKALATKLNDEISNLTSEYDQMRNDKDIEIKTLNEQIISQEASMKHEIGSKYEMISQIEANYQGLKTELEELQKLRIKEKEDMELIVTEKDSEKQVRVAMAVICQITSVNVVSVSQCVISTCTMCVIFFTFI